MPIIIAMENIIKELGQRKIPLWLLHDDICEELAFLYIFPKGKFGYSVHRSTPVSITWYFNQGLLNFNQNFASDPDYTVFDRSVYENALYIVSVYQ